MGGVEPCMFGIDRDKKFDRLASVQRVEENGRDIDLQILLGLGTEG